MPDNPRKFEAGPDPFGRQWKVEFRWLQTAISIRHSDSVDVKFELTHGDEVIEKVVALMHPDIIELAARLKRPITDPWCMRLAAMHVVNMVETYEDFEKTLVTVSPQQLAEYGAKLAGRSPATVR